MDNNIAIDSLDITNFDTIKSLNTTIQSNLNYINILNETVAMNYDIFKELNTTIETNADQIDVLNGTIPIFLDFMNNLNDTITTNLDDIDTLNANVNMNNQFIKSNNASTYLMTNSCCKFLLRDFKFKTVYNTIINK